MDPRQEQLLLTVIEQYITTAEPVGSKFLVTEADVEWSEATVRNELRALEEGGFLTHPHTSAGRIPTAQGYRYYVDRLDFSKAKVSKGEEKKLADSLTAAPDYEAARKNLAKSLVEVSTDMVLIAFNPDRVYYTGLSNLFQKRDFEAMDSVVNVSAVFDRCEEALEEFFPLVSADPRYFIGAEHQFGDMLSVLAMRFGDTQDSLIAVFGPQRMNYLANWGLMQKVKELI